jgi:hypothetical protein
MADRAVASEFFEVLGLKDLRDQTHPLVRAERPGLGPAGNNPRAFLPPVLKREETIISQHRRIGMIEHRENSAFVRRLVRSGRTGVHRTREITDSIRAFKVFAPALELKKTTQLS